MLTKAVIHSRYGNAEVLQVVTLERPVPRKNEVLVRVMAAGLDFGQWHLMAGKPYVMRLATGGLGRTLRAALWSIFLKQRLVMLVGFVKPEPLQALADIPGAYGRDAGRQPQPSARRGSGRNARAGVGEGTRQARDSRRWVRAGVASPSG